MAGLVPARGSELAAAQTAVARVEACPRAAFAPQPMLSQRKFRSIAYLLHPDTCVCSRRDVTSVRA